MQGVYGLHIDGKKVSFSIDASVLNGVMKRLIECETVSLRCAPPELEDLFLHYYEKDGAAK